MKYISSLLLLLVYASSLFAQVLKTAEQEQLLEFYQSQRYVEASGLLQRSFGNDPQDLKATAMLAYASNMAGDLKLAEKQYLKLNNADSTNIGVLFNLAGIYTKRGNDEKAKAFYRRVLAVDSNNIRALKLLALTNLGTDEKMKYLSRANQLNPADGDIAYELATALSSQQQLSAAYVILFRAYRADTSNYLLLKAKLPICIAMKKLEEAQETGDKLLKNGDSSSFVVKSMARLSMEKKDYRKAISLFKVLEERSEANESSLYFTALCYQKLKELKPARDYIKATIKTAISPNTSSYYVMLAYLNESAGAFKAAQSAYLKALHFSDKGSIYYSLGVLNDQKLGNKVAAQKYYKRYLQSKPDEKLAADNISYVKDRMKILGK